MCSSDLIKRCKGCTELVGPVTADALLTGRGWIPSVESVEQARWCGDQGRCAESLQVGSRQGVRRTRIGADHIDHVAILLNARDRLEDPVCAQFWALAIGLITARWDLANK